MIWRLLRYFLSRRNAGGILGRPASCEGLRLYRIRSYQEYLVHQARSSERLAEHKRRMLLLSSRSEKSFHIPGYSYVAETRSGFLVIRGPKGDINWRETVNCRVTGFNNRMRATLQVLDLELELYGDSKIYITEQVTPLYWFLASRFPEIIGSEFLGDKVLFGCNADNGVRNETLCALSFADGMFDAVISLDVLEHISDYELAFKECARVLKSGGRMMWSVPFVANSPMNFIRAKIQGGEIVHMLEPEYHGDPLSSEGVLCFQHFGWEMLDQVRAAGFRDAYALCYHSIEFGYLGGEQFIFVAVK